MAHDYRLKNSVKNSSSKTSHTPLLCNNLSPCSRIDAHHQTCTFENTYNNEAQQMLTTNGAPLNASSELDQLRQENELLKIQIEQLKRQIEQWKESIKKPNDIIDKLEEIIVERDDDIDTLKKEIDGAPLSPDDEPKSISFIAQSYGALLTPWMVP
jgi:peptidoglycan hydrolase CwlO-like protein